MLRTSTTHDDYARSVERLLEGGSAVGLSEAQLVERFAGRRDEAAFAALVDRHGPMVLGVCRRFLRDPNDADDAFQAVFLVLARKAGGLRRKELVANWLHGVARRVASEARRRPRPATPGDASAFDADARRPAPPDPSDAAARDEDGRRLHEEVGRLPERYRAPVVVCYFEGRTHEEAAALLNWPVGTVKGRLARARDLLRARLERRGVTAPAALLATALAAPDLRAAVPPALASRAVAAALAVAASPSAWMTSAALSTTARSLSEGAIQAMFYAQLKAIAIPAALAAGLLAAGAGLAAAGRQAPQEPGEPAPAPAVAKVADPPTPTETPPPESPAAPERPASRSVSDALVEVWQIADNCRKSYEAAIQSSQPVKAEEQAAAMSRHRDRVGRLGKAVRDRAAGDPLLLSLADYLDFRSKSPAKGPGGAAVPDLAIDMIARVPGNLQALLQSAGLASLRLGGHSASTNTVDLIAKAWRDLGFDPSEFDRQLLQEKLVMIQHRVLEESLLQAEREPEASDLLTRHAEYVRKLLAEAPPPPQTPKLVAAATTSPSTGADPAATPAVPDEAPPTFARADLSLSPEEVLDLIDGTGKAVVQRMKESDVDLAGASTTQEAIEVVDHLCDEVDEHVRRLRSAKVAEPNGRALLDAFADSLARLLQTRGGKAGPGVGPVQDAEALDEPYLVFRRSVNRARLQAAGGPQAREAAGRRHRSTIAPILKALREPTQQPITKPLLAAYADYLEAIDPFAEAPGFRRVSADAPPSEPPAAQDRPAARGVEAVLKDVWKVVDQYQKSYQVAIQSHQPGKPEQMDEALARHRERVGRLEKDVRARVGADPLLQSLADYLVVASKPSTGPLESNVGPIMTFSVLGLVRSNLQEILKRAREGMGPELDPFDRELVRDTLAGARDRLLAGSYNQAERDPEARDLLTRHADYVAKLLSIDSYVFPTKPAPAPGLAVAPPAAEAPSREPANPAASLPSTSSPSPSGGGFGGSGGPSPGEMRQKVAGLAATLAIVDDEPSNRKVHDALDRPSALKAEGKSTLGEVIEQVKKVLKAEDGSPIPVYVDPKGLEDADAALDSPVSIDLEGVPLKFSLRLALKQLGLAYCVRDGVLIISSLEGIEQELLEAQRELMSTHPGSFILQPDGTTLPAAGMGRPGGMM
ncbi:MAG: hypothetical protein BGO49_21540 [Planctomycetales bacterium 71-10]|nr:MAG: hypothetical protein BGO49_21540 [Planctomycetales bacterium 71-10]